MKDDLGDRMKQYESVTKNYMTRRTPVIVRCDGKSFHTFCKRFERPYDAFFNKCMNIVMEKICSEVQGAKFAERHSDEISILITDYDKINTDSYFDYNVQKIVSVIASMATAELCRQLIIQPVKLNILKLDEDWPMFDCRCFNVPEDDVVNYFWWRQRDAVRNSINMLAQSKFSHKDLQGKSCDEMQEMLFQEHEINWNNIPQGQKAGFSCVRETIDKAVENGPNAGSVFKRKVWKVLPSVATRQELEEMIQPVITNNK